MVSLFDGSTVETAYAVIILLGVDIESLVLDVVVPFLEFPVDVLGLKDLSDTRFEDQCVSDPGDLFRFDNVFELNTPVGKMTDHGQRVFLLHPFLPCALIYKGALSWYCWLIRHAACFNVIRKCISKCYVTRK